MEQTTVRPQKYLENHSTIYSARARVSVCVCVCVSGGNFEEIHPVVCIK